MLRTAYLLLLTTALLWGGNAVAGKLAVGHVSPLLLTTIRWGLAVVIMLLIGGAQLRRDWAVVKRNFVLLFALGAVGFGLFNAIIYSALNYTSAINVSIEQAGMPMVIFIANFLLFRMRVSWAQIVGFLLSLAGVILTASHGSLARLLSLDVNFGDALMMVGIVLYGGYTVALRLKPQIHWQSLILVLGFSAFVSSLPFAAWELAAGEAIWPDTKGWIIAAYTAIFPSLVSQVCYIRGIEMIGANRAGLFINMVPIFGTLLSVILIGEDFRPYHALAMAMVLGGIWLAENSSRKAETGLA